MIVVGNSIVSDDIADQRFGCDLCVCKGACCVDGDSGAPLLEEEVEKLEAVLPQALPSGTMMATSAHRLLRAAHVPISPTATTDVRSAPCRGCTSL